jgi:glutamate racemase
MASGVEFLESGAPVARQTRRLLEAAELLNTGGGELTALATGSDDSLRWALTRWRMA